MGREEKKKKNKEGDRGAEGGSCRGGFSGLFDKDFRVLKEQNPTGRRALSGTNATGLLFDFGSLLSFYFFLLIFGYLSVCLGWMMKTTCCLLI